MEKLQDLGLPLGQPGKPPPDLQQYCQAYKACSGQEQDQARFDEMLGKLREWRERYYTAIVPQKVCNVPQGSAFTFCLSAPMVGGRMVEDVLGALLSSSECLLCPCLDRSCCAWALPGNGGLCASTGAQQSPMLSPGIVYSNSHERFILGDGMVQMSAPAFLLSSSTCLLSAVLLFVSVGWQC